MPPPFTRDGNLPEKVHPATEGELWIDSPALLIKQGRISNVEGLLGVLPIIENDDQLLLAQKAVENLQLILVAARKVHSLPDYRRMSAPILLELQQR